MGDSSANVGLLHHVADVNGRRFRNALDLSKVWGDLSL